MKLSETVEFNEFFKAFVEAALWSSFDDNDEPLDTNYSIDDINDDGLEILKAHALSFYSRCHYYLSLEKGKTYSDLGHDFWLSSACHGVGFWDKDRWPRIGENLDKLAKCYPCEHLDLMEWLNNGN